MKVKVPDDIREFRMVKIVDPKKLIIEEKEHKPYFSPKEYAKKYRQGVVNIGGDEKIDNAVKKKRDDVRKKKYAENKLKILTQKNLWSLNKGLVTKPTQGTIDKYKLTKDGNVWSSSLM